jgi:uncharacterized phage protein gp47/JayE
MAAFENKTIKEIRDLLYTGVMLEFNNSIRILPKSFIKVICTVFAGVFIFLYKMIGWVFLQLFPETAYWKEVNILGLKIRPLVKWGILIGVGEPRPGTQWQSEIAVHVTALNSALIAGTQLKSDITGKLYLIDETKTLENETEILSITCTETGKAGSLETGDILNFVSPLGNVEKEVEVTSIIQDATEAETEAEYRSRVVNRWRMQPQGGSLADYRIWASEVAGVYNTYPYNDPNTASGVLLYVSGNPLIFPDRIPSAALLKQVGDACIYDPNRGNKAYRKPMGATIDPRGDGSYANVRSVVIIVFDIYIYGLIGIPAQDFADMVRTPLDEYFLGREPYIRGLSDDNNKKNIVSKNNVSSVIDQTAISHKAEFDSVSVFKNGILTPSYTLGMGELCKIRNLYIDGVLY